MKLIILGTGSAFTLENYQSNMLVEAPEGRLLIDCGSDARRSVAAQGFSALDITDVYISHLHADHIGGLEWLGLVTYFTRTRNDPSRRPRLHLRRSLVDDLWLSLHGGMGTIEGHIADLDSYFEVPRGHIQTASEIICMRRDKRSLVSWRNRRRALRPRG